MKKEWNAIQKLIFFFSLAQLCTYSACWWLTSNNSYMHISIAEPTEQEATQILTKKKKSFSASFLAIL